MKYVVAVSGGVDSVVLLDMLANSTENQLVVAHFEHGIRGESSQADARFVEALAAKYELGYEVGYGNLGSDASEEEARSKRYEFLKSIALKYDAQLVTAHHQDDLVESIAINLTRGTGWRGLAVFGDSSITRPLLSMTKNEIYEYALHHSLEWVEDETNQTRAYLRNRLRRKLYTLDDSVRSRLVELCKRQVEVKQKINEEAERFALASRYFLTMVDESVAMELLHTMLAHKNTSLTRPQRQRLLLAIKTAKAGDVFQAGNNITVRFTLREFIVN